MTHQTYTHIEAYMRTCMSDSAHDVEHIYRVLYNALQIAEGATVILTASTQVSADKAVAQFREKYPQATVAGIIDWPYEVTE